jgi:uncharacterized membrane protein
MIYVVAYIGALIAIFVADMIWFAITVNRLYRPILANILLEKINLKAALTFYLIYPLGLMVFAVGPALKSGALSDAALYGALYGFFTYVTYDLTCQATLRNWTTKLSIIDILWGAVLGTIAASCGFLLASKILGLSA